MFHLKKSTNGQFYFILKGDNHEPLMSSETYLQRQSALKGMQAVVKITTDQDTNDGVAMIFIDETTGAAHRAKFPL